MGEFWIVTMILLLVLFAIELCKTNAMRDLMQSPLGMALFMIVVFVLLLVRFNIELNG